MRVSFDPEANMAFISLIDIPTGGVARTVSVDEEGLNLDFDSQGRLVGIEIFDPRNTLPEEVLNSPEVQVLSRKLGPLEE